MMRLRVAGEDHTDLSEASAAQRPLKIWSMTRVDILEKDSQQLLKARNSAWKHALEHPWHRQPCRHSFWSRRPTKRPLDVR